MMRCVLGIDAAWTSTQPSGVALVRETPKRWQLVAVAASYHAYHMQAGALEKSLENSEVFKPVASDLLATSHALCGAPVDLIAIDMPLSHQPITGRRISDNLVSRLYGSRKCGTHTPSAIRPGRISDVLKQGFEAAGYSLLTHMPAAHGLIEAYPHPALVELTSAPERLPYKAKKIGKYWPELNAAERRIQLFRKWDEIVIALDREIDGVADALPKVQTQASGAALKAYEDALDAVICAWIGICALTGTALPYGDDNSAIWIPKPGVAG
jgi:predicted RNase H-like nuclease